MPLAPGGRGWTKTPRVVGDSSQTQMNYSSQVVDLTQAQEYVGYAAEGFQGYDRMEEDDRFYQPQEEAEGTQVPSINSYL